MKLCGQAVLAGLCASLASVFAKLAVASQSLSGLCVVFMQATLYGTTSFFDKSIFDHWNQVTKSSEFCSWVNKTFIHIDACFLTLTDKC